MKKRYIWTCIMLYFLVVATTCSAQEVSYYTYSQSNLDIIFVVDYSNSMNSNDRGQVGLEMIEAFIDSVYAKKMRIGFVAYNQNILASIAPQDMSTQEQRTALKKEINSLSRTGSTDIGLALKEATSLFSSDQDRQSIIILISDGEPDLTYAHTGRTLEDCYLDMENAAQVCKGKKIPIYTIAFGKNFAGEPTCLENLALKTSATTCRASEAGDLIEVFNDIIEKYTISSIIPIASSVSSGEIQSVDISFESMYTSEMNVLLVSSTPINEAVLAYDGQEVEFSKSKYYFTAKIDSPKTNVMTLKYSAPKDAIVKVYTLPYQNADFELLVPTTIRKNQPIEVKAYFINNSTFPSAKI